VLSERARELAGSVQLQTKSFAIELRVDGTLNKGEFRVQPVWDEPRRATTMVTVRPATTNGRRNAREHRLRLTVVKSKSTLAPSEKPTPATSRSCARV